MGCSRRVARAEISPNPRSTKSRVAAFARIAAIAAAIQIVDDYGALAADNGIGQTTRSWDVLSNFTLFEAPLAAPRSPEFSLSAPVDTTMRHAVGALGGRLPLWTYRFSAETAVQIGIDGGVWSSVRRRGIGTFPLESSDYLMGVPVMAMSGQHALELCFSHISAHLGDGAEDGRPPVTFSREFISARYAHTIPIGGRWSRLYVTAAYLAHTIPAQFGRKSAGGGFELWQRESSAAARWYVASDVTYNGDTDSFDLSGQVGLALATERSDRASMRIALSGFRGKDRRGQFFGQPRQQVSFGFHIRYR